MKVARLSIPFYYTEKKEHYRREIRRLTKQYDRTRQYVSEKILEYGIQKFEELEGAENESL